MSVNPIFYRRNEQGEGGKVVILCSRMGESEVGWCYFEAGVGVELLEANCLLCESRGIKLRAFGCCSAKAGEVTRKVTRGHLLCTHCRMKGFKSLAGEVEGMSPVSEC